MGYYRNNVVEHVYVFQLKKQHITTKIMRGGDCVLDIMDHVDGFHFTRTFNEVASRAAKLCGLLDSQTLVRSFLML